MPPTNDPKQKPQRTGPKHPNKDNRYVLSSRAQAALMWILEDVIEKTLEDARNMAEAAGKKQVELTEVEEALKRLCERYHQRWQSETAKEKKSGLGQGKPAGKRR